MIDTRVDMYGRTAEEKVRGDFLKENQRLKEENIRLRREMLEVRLALRSLVEWAQEEEKK